MGVLALLSGQLLAPHARSNPQEHNEGGEWKGSELFLASAFFIALFIVSNAVAFKHISG